MEGHKKEKRKKQDGAQPGRQREDRLWEGQTVGAWEDMCAFAMMTRSHGPGCTFARAGVVAVLHPVCS